MRLPWDRNWFKGCFYLVVTFTMIYIIKLIIDGCAYALVNVWDVTGAFFAFLRKAASVLSPIIMALVLYYALKPLAAAAERRLKSRRLACAGIFLLMLLLPLTLILCLLLRLRQLGGGSLGEGVYILITQSGSNLGQAYLGLRAILEKTGLDSRVMPYINKAAAKAAALIGSAHLLRAAVSCCLNLLLGLLMAFYLLISPRPFDRLGEILPVMLPKRLYNALKALSRDLDGVFCGYIRGQLADGLIMSLLITLGLWLIKIPFAPVIGIISGFSNIIPYFGSAVGFLLTAAAALFSGEYIRIVYGLLVMLALQQLDSAVIVPKIVGKRVEISPFGVVAALSVGGRIFGIWGLVLAVPAAAVGKALILRAYERKKRPPEFSEGP